MQMPTASCPRSCSAYHQLRIGQQLTRYIDPERRYADNQHVDHVRKGRRPTRPASGGLAADVCEAPFADALDDS